MQNNQQYFDEAVQQWVDWVESFLDRVERQFYTASPTSSMHTPEAESKNIRTTFRVYGKDLSLVDDVVGNLQTIWYNLFSRDNVTLTTPEGICEHYYPRVLFEFEFGQARKALDKFIEAFCPKHKKKISAPSAPRTWKWIDEDHDHREFMDYPEMAERYGLKPLVLRARLLHWEEKLTEGETNFAIKKQDPDSGRRAKKIYRVDRIKHIIRELQKKLPSGF